MFNIVMARLPEWLIFLIFPSGALLCIALLVSVFRKISGKLKLDDYDGDILDTATQNTLSGAFVVLGFSLVLVMGTTDRFESDVTTEATRIVSMDRLLVLEGSPQATALRGGLKQYSDSVVTDEWPMLSSGRGSKKTAGLLQDLFKELEQLKPQDPRQVSLYGDIVRKSDEIYHSRATRILNSRSSLPTLFWIVNYLSLAGVIIIASLRLMQPTSMRILALCTQIVLISVLFSAVLIIDHPFMGGTNISPDPIAKALVTLQPPTPPAIQ